MADLDPIKEVAVARPGDTIVFRVGREITHKQFDELMGWWRGVAPDGLKALFVSAEEMVVYRPEVGSDG
jgi:hypothetical protein